MSFVYQVFEAVPLLIVRGDKGTGKSELGDAIARVSCNATVIGQGSAASVIRLMNEARGLVVLDDLESIGRVLEGTSFGDINQMLKLGYKKRTGQKAITDKNGKTTVFDFYGPKIINNTRGVDSILGSRMIHIQTRHIPDALRDVVSLTGSEEDELIQLRNELHIWGMTNARIIHECYVRLVNSKRDRRSEIAAPLLAIAELTGDAKIRSSFEAALERQFVRRRQVDNPIDLLREAISNCIGAGATERLSSFQILLELRLLAEESPEHLLGHEQVDWLQPEWVGYQLRSLRIRKAETKVGRNRLYGIVTRIYDLRDEYVRAVLHEIPAAASARRGPLDFCEQAVCSECRYEKVCAATVRGLRINKFLNKGRSGRCRLVSQTPASV
jgi:hypothetical protein